MANAQNLAVVETGKLVLLWLSGMLRRMRGQLVRTGALDEKHSLSKLTTESRYSSDFLLHDSMRIGETLGKSSKLTVVSSGQ